MTESSDPPSDETAAEPQAQRDESRARRPDLLKRLYNWTIHWAETPYGPLALFAQAVAASSFFPIPPDALLIALALGAPKKSLRFGGICTLGSVLGGCVGYAIGMFFMEAVGQPIVDLYNAQATYDAISGGFQAHGFLWIFGAALTPIPYKVFTIAAGACDINFGVFLAASVMGRSLRFYAIAVLFRVFGPRIKRFIDRYFSLLACGFMALLVLGFLFVTMVWQRNGDESPKPEREPHQERIDESATSPPP